MILTGQAFASGSLGGVELKDLSSKTKLKCFFSCFPVTY